MDKILLEFNVSRLIEISHHFESHTFKPDEDRYYCNEHYKGDKAIFVLEENDDDNPKWYILFNAPTVTEEWIQEQCRAEKKDGTMRKVAGYAAAFAIGATIMAVADALKIQSDTSLAKDAYEAIAGEEFDEEAFRKNCIVYSRNGSQELRYCKYKFAQSISRYGAQSIELGRLPENCTVDVDPDYCITFFYAYDKKKHVDTVAKTIVFQSKAYAKRVYSLIKQYR